MTSSCAGGLAWLPQWVGAGEGPYTRLSKLSIANPVSLDLLQRLLVNRCPPRQGYPSPLHPRSLLSDTWMRRGTLAGMDEWSRNLRQSTLSNVLDTWTHHFASDQAFRYCPSCLDQGFQSSLCQIDALTHCPVHGDALRNTCIHCNAPMPRYAWDEDLTRGRASLHCKQCYRPHSGAWQRSSQLNWRAMPGAQAYDDLATRMQAFRSVSWLDDRAWKEAFRWCDAGEPAARFRACS